MRVMLLLLLLLFISLETSVQQTMPPGRCDIDQRIDLYTECTSCAAAITSSCPKGFSKEGTQHCSYVVEIGGKKEVLKGCYHLCVKSFLQPRCCPERWGTLCLECPKWSGKTCNLHGTCQQGDTGNGTCACDNGFSGFACHECKNPKAYGENCDKECDCVHGVCNKGPDGDGQCLCQPPYFGKRCDQVTSSCKSCSPYSYCKGEGDAAVCECLPGYRRTPQNKCASVCSGRDCGDNAQCSATGSKITCSCKADYEGDGRICVPKNPCTINNGGCPDQFTVCVFKGPNKSSCECVLGTAPVNGDPMMGCEPIVACTNGTCHPSATCTTGVDGEARCMCEGSQIGDGKRCYGNLMTELITLDRSGSQREKLTGAVALFMKGCFLILSHAGPFTVFIPLLKAPLTGINEDQVCKNHLLRGQYLYKDLEGKDFILYNGLRLRSKDNKKFILKENPQRVYTIVQQDLPAANGIIHIIDLPITDTLPEQPTKDDQFADKTIGEILAKDGRFNRFLSLADNCGAPLPFRGPGPLTVFVPTNQAVDKARDGSILYMLNDAKYKLQELLRNHIYSQAVLTVDELTTLPRIQTMANQIVTVNVSDKGEIILGEKGIRLTSTNIIASNGVIHLIDGLLYPASILPILPHRCDVTESKITVGPCVHCSYLYTTNCPEGSIELDNHLTGCDYVVYPLMSLSKGCAKYCNVTKKRAECCPGFYGPDCKPCIGGFQHPCYDKGACLDGILGNGSCSCRPGFQGIACHICSDPSKHGDQCDEVCKCVHGVCDNRPGSGGVCRAGSCLKGFSGENCDKQATSCNSEGLLEHCHIHAYCTHTGLQTKCICRDGYTGDGHSCHEVNPCLLNNRGGCDTNARCVYVGPGNASCQCIEGWTGDGKVCVEINNCQLQSRGGCSVNADCNHVGPGQSDCVCKSGFMGDGLKCDPVDPCLISNGGCHELAKCEQKASGTHTCTCPDGYTGDGRICYATVLEEMEMNVKMYRFSWMMQRYRHHREDLSGNVTLLVPSREAVTNMSLAETSFWTSRHHLPHFVRAHILQGIYSLEDLERMVGKSVSSLNNDWEIRNISGRIYVGNASIITQNLPATNGYLHIMDKVMTPPRSGVPPEPATLMAFLNMSSNFTLFRKYALMYHLSGELAESEYTLLLPTDGAVRQHLTDTNSSLLGADVLKYHVISNELLFPDKISHGTLKSTLLGKDFQVQFHIDSNNQTAVNDVPLDGSFMETQFGLVMFVHQVLKVQRNRCSQTVRLETNGRCTDCQGPPRCIYGQKPIMEQFSPQMKSNCRYRKRVGTRRKWAPGCIIPCLKVTTDMSCCPGYYGHECFKCPGEVGSWCSNHGECQDGNLGNGECRCFEGFHGTACEDCEPGRYGVNCSSKCTCDHGKCSDGLSGNGKCECYKGWKGKTCSIEIKDDACGGSCDENANCITDPKGTSAICLCVAGYEGNGTFCKELDLCSRSNGGCSQFANCTKISAGQRTCTCHKDYTGDGVVCLEVDGCLVNNGGCHRSAECIRTGPNMVACRCLEGFQGSGKFCFPVNPCNKNNGGCSTFARCEYLGQGKRNCSCFRGYVGDGFICRGNTRAEVLRAPENNFFRQMFTLGASRGLSGDGPYTVFVPTVGQNTSILSRWHKASRHEDLAAYHIVSCEALTVADLGSMDRVITTSGYPLYFSLHQGTVWINNRTAKIVQSDWKTSNGIIQYIDSVLTPYNLEDKPEMKPDVKMNFTDAVKIYGYSRFAKLVEDAGLLPIINMKIHHPFTMFWPTDRALSSLPAERQHWLANPEHQEQLAALVKAHMIRYAKIYINSPQRVPITYRSMHGSSISMTCDKNQVGGVILNDDEARLVERLMTFKEGIAYGIDHLLEPPGLGAFCDAFVNKTTYGPCGSCIFTPPCPIQYIDTGDEEPCLNPRYRHSMNWYSHFPSLRRGCRRVCLYPSWQLKCCKNHYGSGCQVCPGGLEAPCSNHGDCQDGHSGSGRCRCYNGFTGTACEQCAFGHYGPNCTACSCTHRGRCDQGIEGSGQCTCDPGWKGDQCQIDIGSIPEECRQCHAHADCIPGTGCQCRNGFQGNGTSCSPEPPPDLCASYNGNCNVNANCSQIGLFVNCTCHSGYQGDGLICEPINRCVQEPNGGCSDFASCKFTGPNERTCECFSGYVGNGVQCLEKLVPPVDRCLSENGYCHPVATCEDLHYFDSKAGVFHLRAPEGKYKMNFTQAGAACQAAGSTLASLKQLGDAQQLGMHLCVAGWMDEGKVGYPTTFPSKRCGDNHVGVVLYQEPVDLSSKYDAYCYRLKDVSCTCPPDYVGDGDYCNGVLTNVLATNSNFSIFYKFLLDYSSSSKDGQQLVEFLSHRKSEVTLFVPHNSGFTQNQTLSGRDLEYHVWSHVRRPYKDLMHQEVITSKLGANLTITHGNDQNTKLVNQRLLVNWDIPAVNGILHVITGPLSAPPPPMSPHGARGQSHSSGTVSAILVSVLLLCVLCAFGYYIFKQKSSDFRFHYFKNDDEDVPSSKPKKPTLVSIPNPLYSGARAFNEPFADTGESAEAIEPEEPPNLLNLDE
ncbi:stabilin-1-like isoform 1-T2 [Synchiropus picturatus]